MLSFKGGKLVLRESVTMLRSRDVIHKGLVSKLVFKTNLLVY